MSSIFTKIIKGEIPCYQIFEDNLTMAFLDIRPLHHGQTLLVPKVEVDHFFELDEEYYHALFATAKKLAPAIKLATNAKRVALVIEGLEVAHVHIKLIPINQGGDLDHHHVHDESQEELKSMQEKIIQHLVE